MPSDTMEDADIAEYLLQVDLPAGSWCSAAKAPGERTALRVLGVAPLADGRVIEDIDILGADWRIALQRIQDHPNVFSASALRHDNDGATVRVIHKGCAVVQAIVTTGVLPRFPLRLHERQEQCRLQATSGQVEEFARALRGGGMHARVHGVRAPTSGSVLTTRQQEVLEAAVRAGYYASPRRTSLTELAQELRIAKSTLSELLVSIEHRVMAQPLAGDRR